jgi:hypothetical protein
VRESSSSCSERERDEEDDAEAVAEEEQRMVAAGRGLGLRWLRLRRGGEQRGEASQWGGLQRRRGSVRAEEGWWDPPVGARCHGSAGRTVRGQNHGVWLSLVPYRLFRGREIPSTRRPGASGPQPGDMCKLQGSSCK